eukprot:TRINITY_DN19893_c0_g1_i1.p1 TRINITY_DN19893_c0_g1~~TRINITY_DN19893_c0_g1_i1.p1  ORF type:complete len:495 (-),score=75.19 TRINITY_DN19893_c0_g1_i1:110-1594(-)
MATPCLFRRCGRAGALGARFRQQCCGLDISRRYIVSGSSEEEVHAGSFVAAPKRVYPPTSEFGDSKAEAFASLLSRTLAGGVSVSPSGTAASSSNAPGLAEMKVGGSRAASHTLRALADAAVSAEFQVRSLPIDNGDKRELWLSAWGVREADAIDADAHLSKACFVSSLTPSMKLAEKLRTDLRRSRQVALLAYVDAEKAMDTMLKALAAVQGLREGDYAASSSTSSPGGGGGQAKPLNCRVVYVEQGNSAAQEEAVPRLLVLAKLQPGDKLDDSVSSKDFLAFPPGDNPNPEVLRKFRDAVRYRLLNDERTEAIVMECRGRSAVSQSLLAMAQAQGRQTPDFQVHWVDGIVHAGSVAEKTSKIPRALRIRAVRGPTWDEFNRTDFEKTNVIRATAESNVRGLAKAIGSEVSSNGGVSLHADSGNHYALQNALKAIASVPVQWKTLRVRCIPSLSKEKSRKNASAENAVGGGIRVLRLYIMKINDAAVDTKVSE